MLSSTKGNTYSIGSVWPSLHLILFDLTPCPESMVVILMLCSTDIPLNLAVWVKLINCQKPVLCWRSKNKMTFTDEGEHFFPVLIGESYVAIMKITGHYSPHYIEIQVYFFNSGLWLAEKWESKKKVRSGIGNSV